MQANLFLGIDLHEKIGCVAVSLLPRCSHCPGMAWPRLPLDRKRAVRLKKKNLPSIEQTSKLITFPIWGARAPESREGNDGVKVMD